MLHSTCGSVSMKMWGRKCCIFDDFSLCYSRSVTDPKICYKCVCSRGSARNPAGGAHEAPPDPLVAWAPHPTPLGACGTSTLSPVGDPQYFFLQIGHWEDGKPPPQKAADPATFLLLALLRIVKLTQCCGVWLDPGAGKNSVKNPGSGILNTERLLTYLHQK